MAALFVSVGVELIVLLDNVVGCGWEELSEVELLGTD